MSFQADLLSMSGSVDPAFSVETVYPPANVDSLSPYWYYRSGDLECFWLEQLRSQVKIARLMVGYPGTFRSPAPEVGFTCQVPAGSFRFRAYGQVRVQLSGRILADYSPSYAIHEVCLPESGQLTVWVSVSDTSRGIPGLMSFGNEAWTAVGPAGEAWGKAQRECRLYSGEPPHLLKNPEIPVQPVLGSDGFWDTGRELLARIEICCESGEPRLFVGESKAEAANRDSASFEQSCELLQVAPGTWRSRNYLACRYLCIEGATVSKVTCLASFAPLKYQGAFVVSDDELANQIWLRSAYTLRLCINYFLLDGIKRDRLPWGGDLVISMLGMAYSFGEGSWARHSLKVLGTNLSKGHDVNTLVDYSMWMIISHDLYQRYFADRTLLDEDYSVIVDKLDDLVERYDYNRLISSPHGHSLIDWGHPPVEYATQMLFAWSLRAGQKLARRMDDTSHMKRWSEAEASVLQWLDGHAKTESGLYYGENPQVSQALGRHVNIFAVLSGVAQGEQARAIAEWLSRKDVPEVATPYMAVLDAMAIARGGLPQVAMEKIKRLWGGMVKEGATSFWEAYDENMKEEEHLAFYDRKFGKSLCHAWGSGPVFALPLIVWGLRPLEDGWKTFTMEGQPKVDNQTAMVRVPTPSGMIEAQWADGKVSLQAPHECQFQP